MGGAAEVEYMEDGFPLTCDGTLIDIVSGAARKLWGEDKLFQLIYPSMGAEDFANYLKDIPGVFFRVGTADLREESKLPLHNCRIVFNEEALTVGAATLCQSAVDWLNS